MNLDYFKIQFFLGNFSFIALFIIMIFYWVQISFFSTRKMHFLGTIGMILVNSSLFCLLFMRWLEHGHYPLSNLYESLIFLSWSLTLLHVFLEKTTQTFFLGAITSPIILFINGFANFSLPEELQKSTALVPALHSNWLMMHVTVMMLSYAALLAGCLFSIALLIFTINKKPISFTKRTVVSTNTNLAVSATSNLNQVSELKTEGDWGFSTPVEKSFNSFFQTETFESSTQFAQILDNLSYRTLGIGFSFLTIGILSGAVWANEAWGSYWSWDPKETWALITWLVFAIYLHTRIMKGWEGKKPAIIASVGFFVVWICYLGVNLLGKGLHSYGWLS